MGCCTELEAGIFVILQPEDLVLKRIFTMLSDEMKQLAEYLRSRKLLGKNNSCVNTTNPQPIFREQQEIFPVESHEYAVFIGCIDQLLLVGPSCVSRCLSCQTVDPPFLEHLSKERGKVFIQIEIHPRGGDLQGEVL